MLINSTLATYRRVKFWSNWSKDASLVISLTVSYLKNHSCSIFLCSSQRPPMKSGCLAVMSSLEPQARHMAEENNRKRNSNHNITLSLQLNQPNEQYLLNVSLHCGYFQNVLDSWWNLWFFYRSELHHLIQKDPRERQK